MRLEKKGTIEGPLQQPRVFRAQPFKGGSRATTQALNAREIHPSRSHREHWVWGRLGLRVSGLGLIPKTFSMGPNLFVKRSKAGICPLRGPYYLVGTLKPLKDISK